VVAQTERLVQMKRVYFVELKKRGKWELVKFGKQSEADGWTTYSKSRENAYFIARQFNQNSYMSGNGEARVKSKLVSNSFFAKLKK